MRTLVGGDEMASNKESKEWYTVARGNVVSGRATSKNEIADGGVSAKREGTRPSMQCLQLVVLKKWDNKL